MVILRIFVFFKQVQNISIFLLSHECIQNRLLKQIDFVASLQNWSDLYQFGDSPFFPLPIACFI